MVADTNIKLAGADICTGCSACASVCPKGSIQMVEDCEGFLQPEVDTVTCIGCHLCEKTCPILNVKSVCTEEPVFYAGRLKKTEDLNTVSSGGAFWALAQTVLDEDGVVFGAAQFDVDNIRHIRVDNCDDAKLLRRSKYLNSDITGIYKRVKQDLVDGRTVLFSGTGCQIGGLLAYLNKPYDKLITCDVVCHGIPSSVAWRKYRREKESKEGKRIVNIVFRDKSKGWDNNQYRIEYQDGSVEYDSSTRNLFHHGYLIGLYSRKSCGKCIYAKLPRQSDITLADFWQYKGALRDGNAGVSLITVNSGKGKLLLEKSSEYIDLESSDFLSAKTSCRHLVLPPIENSQRSRFIDAMQKKGFFKAAYSFIDSSQDDRFVIKCKRFIKRILSHKMSVTSDTDRKAISGYLSDQSIGAVFAERFWEIPKILSGYKENVCVYSAERLIRGIGKLLRISMKHPESVLKDARRYMAMKDALILLSKKNIPVFYYNRVGKEKTDYIYKESARKRMDEQLTFPVMYDNQEKYKSDLMEIFAELYSPEYIDAMGKIPQVIEKGNKYCHEDIAGKYINVELGLRKTCFQPVKYERTLHIYGRCGAFGYAVEDKDTLPSQIQKYLNDSGIEDIRVVNHGLWGGYDEFIEHNFLYDSIGMKEGDLVMFYMLHIDKRLLKHWIDCGVYYKEITHEWHQYEESKWCFFNQPGHMNHIGYKHAAEIIVKDMLENGFTGRTPSLSSDSSFVPSYLTAYLKDHNKNAYNSEIEAYIKRISDEYPNDDKDSICGAIVMNCNPFTIGHRKLIETAASIVDRLYVFVVEEDKSFFKFEDRFEMVKSGTADLNNVVVVPSGKFIISSQTFPEYFMKDYVQEKNFDVTGDIETFCKYIAPSLQIRYRFAGTEPFDLVTLNYNQSMRRILPEYGMEFREIPRFETEDNMVINATEVRKLLNLHDFDTMIKYVPESTIKVLEERYSD